MSLSHPEQANINRETQHEAWHKWLFMWHILFYSLLVIATISISTDVSGTFIPIPPSIFLNVILLGIWYFGSIVYTPSDFHANKLPSILYFSLGWFIWYNLITYDTSFMLMLFSLFPQIFMFMTLKYAVIGSLALNILVFTNIFPGDNDFSFTILVFYFISLLGSVLLGKFIHAIIEQSKQRKQLIAELQTTRDNLIVAEREAGILQERQRLASEIHDTLTQGFIGIITHLEATEINITDREKVTHHIKVAKNLARANLSESRRFVWNLPPSALNTQSYIDAVKEVITNWESNHQIPVSFSISGSVRTLSEDIQHNLLRILQEALANIFKHAKANHVSVTMTYFDDTVLLDVQDNGIGFKMDNTSTSGFGLNGMRQRAELLHGTLHIESDINEGTTIVAEFPLLSSTI